MTQAEIVKTLAGRAQAVITGLIRTGRAASPDVPNVDGDMIRLDRLAVPGNSYWIDPQNGDIKSGGDLCEAELIQPGFVNEMFRIGDAQ